MARRGIRRAVLADPQQKKVYDWENQFKTVRWGAPLTEGRLHTLVRQIAKHYRIPKPAIVIRSFADRTTLAQATRKELEFSERHKSWTPLVVAHEMAHCVQHHYDMYPRHSDHGRQFVGIMLYILHKFQIMPLSATRPSANFHGVRHYNPYRCRPAGIRHWYKGRR